MSLSVSELRVIGRSLQRDEVTGQEDRKVFFAAVGLRWAGVIMFLAMLALTIATTILLYSLREAGPLRWKIMGGLIMATVALGYSLFPIRDPRRRAGGRASRPQSRAAIVEDR